MSPQNSGQDQGGICTARRPAAAGLSLRRAVFVLLTAVALSGCAAVDKVKGWLSLQPKPEPAAPQAAAAPAPVAAPKPKRPPRETHKEKGASIDPNDLIGLDPPAVERLLGAPANIGKGDPSLIYTYAAPGCFFRIIFYPDLKTSSFHALKYGGVDDKGVEMDASQACIRNLLMAKTNGPG